MTKSHQTTSKSAPASLPIRLVVRGMGHVPSFKNNKKLFVTNDKNREWMHRCVRSFESQLLSACRMSAVGILTADLLQSLIASLPQDDNWKVIPQISVCAIRVPKGEEGAHITIEPIDTTKGEL